MRYLLYVLAILIAMAMQSTVLDFIAIYGIVPDLIIIVVCSISFLEDRRRGTIWGFFIGLIEDVTGSGLLGSLALSRSIVAFFASTILHFRSMHKAASASVVILLLCLINNLLLFFIRMHGTAALMKGLLMQVIFPSIYTVLVAIAIFSVVPESIWEKIYKAEPIPFK